MGGDEDCIKGLISAWTDKYLKGRDPLDSEVL